MDTKYKPCIKCSQTLPLTDFHRHKQMADGHLNKCKVCVVKDVAEWRIKNPDARVKERIREREKKGYKTRQQWLKDLKENAIGVKASKKKYMHKRRLQYSNVTLNELDKFVEEEAYLLCELREKVTNIKWTLDHIVPLNYKNACGLHNAFNFQVVPASWNYKKGNRNMDKFNAISGY